MLIFVLNVILVRSKFERNIGAMSRAMSNMGANQLVLIEPQTDITIEGQKAAATGQKALQNRQVYSSWEAFLNAHPEEKLLIALTARDGRSRKVSDLATTLESLKETAPAFANSTSNNPLQLYLVLGPEDWGLSAKDLESCHAICHIPTYGDNTSLNLAQAGLIALFIVRQVLGGHIAKMDGELRSRDQVVDANIDLKKSLKTWLEEMGFDLSKKKVNAFAVLHRVLMQNTPTPKETRIIEIVIQQSLRKLRELKKLKEHIELNKLNKNKD